MSPVEPNWIFFPEYSAPYLGKVSLDTLVSWELEACLRNVPPCEGRVSHCPALIHAKDEKGGLLMPFLT